MTRCGLCNRSFGSQDALDQHLRDSPAHALSYDCEPCDRSILLDRGASINALDFEDTTPLSHLVHAGNPGIDSMQATEAFLRKRGAKMDGSRGAVKKAWVWFLTYSRLLRHVRPNV